jgi:hypothetical protein
VLSIYIVTRPIIVRRCGLLIQHIELSINDNTASTLRVGVVMINEVRLTQERRKAILLTLRSFNGKSLKGYMLRRNLLPVFRTTG